MPVDDLPTILALLHGADDAWETLHARYRVTVHRERAHAAWRDAHERMRGGRSVVIGLRGSDATEHPVESQELVTVWRQAPDRARIEHAGGDRDGAYGVCAGERWWRYEPRSGAMSNEDDVSVGNGGAGELATFACPSALLGVLRFEAAGRDERAGRHALIAHATPRDRPGIHSASTLAALGAGAERYALAIDARSGVLLASHALRYAEPFHSVEALELSLDEPIDDERFRFEPPPGEPVRGTAPTPSTSATARSPRRRRSPRSRC